MNLSPNLEGTKEEYMKSNHRYSLFSALVFGVCILPMFSVSHTQAFNQPQNVENPSSKGIHLFETSPVVSAYDDHFELSTLNSKWSWIRPNPTYWSLTANSHHMTITTRSQDIWQGNNDAMLLTQNIMASDQNAFIVQTDVQMIPTANYHQAGLLIYQSDNNYVRLSYGYVNKKVFEFGREVNGVYSSVKVNAPDTSYFHMRIAKSGKDYQAYYSLNESDWIFIGSQTAVNISPTKFGLFAFNAKNATPVQIPVRFDYFKVFPYPYDDDFESEILHSKWSWIRGDPTQWSLALTPGSMTITTRSQDIWQSNNDAALLVQNIFSSDQNAYTIQTGVQMNPTANYHQTGLLIYQDDDNYVRLSFGWVNRLAYEFGHEEGGVFSSIKVDAPAATSLVYLRIAKSGTDYQAYFSVDESAWILIGSQTAVNINPTEFGLFAFNAKDETTIQIPAQFDYFKVLPYVDPPTPTPEPTETPEVTPSPTPTETPVHNCFGLTSAGYNQTFAFYSNVLHYIDLENTIYLSPTARDIFQSWQNAFTSTACWNPLGIILTTEQLETLDCAEDVTVNEAGWQNFPNEMCGQEATALSLTPYLTVQEMLYPIDFNFYFKGSFNWNDNNKVNNIKMELDLWRGNAQLAQNLLDRAEEAYRSSKGFSPCEEPGGLADQLGDKFYQDVMINLGIKITPFAEEAFYKWRQQENGTACWNPLATVLDAFETHDPACGDVLYNWMPEYSESEYGFYIDPDTDKEEGREKGNGVRHYSSEVCGAKILSRTLGGDTGVYGYPSIVKMLKKDQVEFPRAEVLDDLARWSIGYKEDLVNEWEYLWNKYHN